MLPEGWPRDNVTITPGTHLPAFEYVHQAFPREIATDVSGCHCQLNCTPEICNCVRQNPLGNVYDAQGRFIPLVHGLDFEDSVLECGPNCACHGQCSNNITQREPLVPHPLHVASAGAKGLGVFAVKPIECGAFICVYAGQYLRAKEANKRLKEYDILGRGHALLAVRELLPSGNAALITFIDATHHGNIARFFNHSCGGGNMDFVTVRTPGSLVPRIAFFAKRNIEAGEELTFAYGQPFAGPGSAPCACGTSHCLGFLPHEDL